MCEDSGSMPGICCPKGLWKQAAFITLWLAASQSRVWVERIVWIDLRQLFSNTFFKRKGGPGSLPAAVRQAFAKDILPFLLFLDLLLP